MITPTHIQKEFEARSHAVGELKALYDAAEERELSAEETAKEARLNESIAESDKRIAEGLETLERERKADESRARFEALSHNEPEAHEVRAVNDTAERLRALARGEIRSIEFGVPEFRDNADLTRGTATDGAELVTGSLYNQIHDLIEESSPILQAGPTVLRTADGNKITVPRVSSHSAASLVAEANQFTDDAPQFATVDLDAYKFGFTVQISSELLQDSAFDVVSFVAAQGGAALGRGLDAEFVSGSGSSRPQGVDNATSGKTTAAVAAVTVDELIDLMHSVIPDARNGASWLFSDATIASVRKLKDSAGQYLWSPSLQAGAPDTLFGYPVYAEPNLADMGTGNTFGVFGNMRGLYVRFAGPVRIDRSDDFAFDYDLSTWRFIVRADSVIVDTVAIRTVDNA